ncbi:MAG TPA: YIP1 family protein [Nitrospiria bacterium]|nr:YIP1 family protein [Nitrospiria bacterium]
MTETSKTEAASPHTPYLARILRAAWLDSQLYEEVEADRNATWQALGVVMLAGLAAGIGTIGHVSNFVFVFINVVVVLIGWAIWAVMTYWIGVHMLPEPQTQSNIGELLRTTGFASAPGLIRILGAVPGLPDAANQFLFLGVAVWMLVAMVIAVRQALDYTSTWRAIGVCLIGWSIQAVILIVTIRAAAF